MLARNDGAHLVWVPPSLTFTSRSGQVATITYRHHADGDTTITRDTCTKVHIARITYIDSGIWEVFNGRKRGTCSFTATNFVRKARGTLDITNQV